ncbi:MAG: 50S ribosomal protein L35 [Deferribacterota bacterium]|nr:50S ribosomal protein L35 [Deferribacterota bacterium]
MRKTKTHSGAKKRFKITGNNKILFGRSGTRHLLSKKSSKRKRYLKLPAEFTGREKIKIKKILSVR